MTGPLSLRPPALPYLDPATGETGTQFGVPAAPQDDPIKREFAAEAGMDIILLPDDDVPRRKEHPKLKAPHITEGTSEPPSPVWAWCPVEGDEKVLYARVAPPGRMQGSLPLEEIEARHAEPLGGEHRFIGTPKGLTSYRISARPWDVLAHEIIGFDEAIVPLTAGRHTLAYIHSVDGYVHAIEPTQLAIALGLWTTHLTRILDVTRQQYQDVSNERQAEHTSLGR